MRIHELAREGDVEGVRRELDGGTSVDVRDPDTGQTPLAAALATPNDTAAVVRTLLAAGADFRARCPDPEDDPDRTHAMTMLAVRWWDAERLRLLLDAGATVREHSGQYDLLMSSFHPRDATIDRRSDPRLLEVVEVLIERGVPLNGRTKYGESGLWYASRIGRFDVIRALLAAGADPAPLGWSPLHHAAALGTADDVRRLATGDLLDQPDAEDRTPWLLCAISGDIEKAGRLRTAGADVRARDREEQNAAMLAILHRGDAFLEWLVDEGLVPGNAEGLDDLLRLAASLGRVEPVRVLLAAGADPRAEDAELRTPVRFATTLEVRRELIAAGGDADDIGGDPSEEHDLEWDDIGTGIRERLRGIERRPLDCSAEEFHEGRGLLVGVENPVVFDVPFWRAMVHARCWANAARVRFDAESEPSEPSETDEPTETDELDDGGPVWCYDRFGQSITQLEDGRVVEVGGEHEDFYDPDFAIYNDVVVFDGEGDFTIYGYPEEVFPSTDFHTATQFEGWIYLIGSIGYVSERVVGRAQVLRLSTDDFHIERLETSGDDPGWISEHRARLEPDATILVRGGQVWDGEGLEPNPDAFTFDLRTHRWSRRPARS